MQICNYNTNEEGSSPYSDSSLSSQTVGGKSVDSVRDYRCKARLAAPCVDVTFGIGTSQGAAAKSSASTPEINVSVGHGCCVIKQHRKVLLSMYREVPWLRLLLSLPSLSAH